MPFLREVPALLWTGIVYAALVVAGQKAAGPASMFDKAQLRTVLCNDCVVLDEFIFIQAERGGDRRDIILCEEYMTGPTAA